MTELRGNVDTRLARLADPARGLDAIVLARAGLPGWGGRTAPARASTRRASCRLPARGRSRWRCAPGTRRRCAPSRRSTTPKRSRACSTERALARELGADCHTPLGAWASPAGAGELQLRSWVGLPDGSAWVSDELSGASHDPDALAQAMARRLRSAGAHELLQRAGEMADV